MKLLKKISAGIVALAMAVSLFGCGKGTTWAAKSGDITIPAGIFIYYEMSSYYEALEILKKDDETITKVSKNHVVEDTAALDWIQNKAADKMAQYVAVENKFEELELSLSDEDESNIDSMVAYYMSNFEENYVDNGISEDSLRKAFISDYKYSAIFKKYYAQKDGVEPVGEDEIKDFYTDEFARVKMIEFKLKDGLGNLLKGEDKEEAIKMAEDYLKRAKNGEDFDDLISDYTEYYDNLVATAEEEQESPAGDIAPDDVEDSNENTAEETTVTTVEVTDETSDESSDDSTATTTPKAEDDSAETDDDKDDDNEEDAVETSAYLNEVILRKVDAISDKSSFSDEDGNYIAVSSADNYSERLINEVFAGKTGTPFLVEDDEVYYIVLRSDILALTDIYDYERENIIWEMKEEDFKELIKDFVKSVDMQRNEDAFKRYSPFKLKV